ncbi:GGDEF domain-containing protein [Aliidiomarina iranensis]|uniref:diguanylate cyclase n=1 Tax=Aliidiomarina iranensis TaxID=1434071 RepID=A0A432VWL6_9GAMM|nr:GGDEF domain-containing protein [Aliidiomarina iranensis]RUO20966.1 GGDEF domain-containing protein [Aliidiomarina iranensis]
MKKPAKNRRLRFSRRLTTHLLVRIGVWSLLAVLCVTTIGFIVSYSAAKEALIVELIQDNNQHLAEKSERLRRTEQSAAILATRFLARYQEFAEGERFQERFDEWYIETEPGVQRLRPEFYEGIAKEGSWFEHISVFVGPRSEPLTPELKARITMAQYVVNELGPAWRNDVTNTHISMPENVLVHYSDTHPWGLLAAPDLVMTDFSVVQSTLQSYNPERKAAWTGLYYDLSADYWTITYQHPVDYKGQHLINASHDMALSTLIEEIIAYQSDIDTRMLFNANGQLIASAETLAEEYQQRGTIELADLTNPLYREVYGYLEQHGINAEDDHFTLRNAIPGELLIGQKIAGLNWWHITLYPYSRLQREALRAPLKISLATLGLLLFILLIVYWLISRHVSRPLRQLADMAMLVGDKKYSEVIANNLMHGNVRSEVGLLVRSFRAMASRILENQKNLERIVSERTAQLAAANEALDQMAHLDGLTGLRNRRAFDKDLAKALLKTEDSEVALLFGDLDKFKPYNDNYGHQAGDEALKAVARCLQNFKGVKVYRYGGEEIAVLAEVPNHPAAKELAETMCKAVFDLLIRHEHSKHQYLSISFGVHLLRYDLGVEGNIRAVDKHLYEAKKAGGNCAQ